MKNLQLIINSCCGSLEACKAFVTKIVKKDREFVERMTVNKQENLFKTLEAFLANNPELTGEAREYIRRVVEGGVVRHYDGKYVGEIYGYAKEHVTGDQLGLIMEVVGRERIQLFRQEGL